MTGEPAHGKTNDIQAIDPLRPRGKTRREGPREGNGCDRSGQANSRAAAGSDRPGGDRSTAADRRDRRASELRVIESHSAESPIDAASTVSNGQLRIHASSRSRIWLSN